MKRTRREVLGVGAAIAGASTAGCLGAIGGATDDDAPRGKQQIEPPVTADDPDYVDVYEAVVPSVARVQTYVESRETVFGPGEGGAAGQGSGFLYDETHLVTNDHVIGDPDTIRVQATDETWVNATVVGRDPYSDLAVVELDAGLPGDPLPVATDLPPVGTRVLVVGAPLGLSGSATQGIVSGRNRTIPASTAPGRFSIADAIQTDAALNPGNSGGPIVTLDGTVVGVATATRGDNIGFGVSARLVNEVVPALIETGSYDHSFMGVSVVRVDPLLAAGNDLPDASGVYVAGVVADGPADGVLRGTDGEATVDGATVPTGGDVIVALDGTEIADNPDLSRYLALETDPGDTVAVTVVRDGSEETLDVTLGERPEP
ncbi:MULTISPECIES: S1C family serine protease [unclassified Halorubrum]|uniref:S1C family serine protease n=1 Tax=unclassified Halorubrum TaxID=2642239 RepID=UPI0010F845B8|nr:MULTISPECIES: trypsin-like peptidase domain-containing protein [unclassified Halorubrum]TKX46050.1 PDZ domain-containing protein [Halorubrum sp. ARQ200]TKX50130.1 PDZ domain-containing protein [Halorubrum sp. ASP121]